MPGSSNPVQMRTTHGGVARNVAESLARLGRSVALVSRVGSDTEGDAIVAALDRLGVATADVARDADCPTGSYIALLEPDGSLAVALADMAIYDAVLPEAIDRALPRLARRPIWFADANLPRLALARLLSLKPAGTFVAVDAVSVRKAERLVSLLEGIDLLFVNQKEAAGLTGLTVATDREADKAARALLESGVGSLVLTRGEKGCLVATPDRLARLPAPPAAPRDVTGAGDALIAGTLFGLSERRGLVDSVRIGQACAAQAVESEDTVPGALNARSLVFDALEDDLPSLEARDP